MAVQIIASKTVKPRHLKLLLWGNTGTRKTESVLRHFPNVLFIDIEGNAEHCTQMPEIPEFLYARTKDLDDIIDLIDQVSAGSMKMPNGQPVQTVALDSVSVLWTIRKDTRAVIAEDRVGRWGKSAEEASMTQLDWTMAKRPLVRLSARLANCPIQYVIFTARESDKYEDTGKADKVAKIGFKPDAIKGLEYEMNLVLHLRFPEAKGQRGPWECEVTKVQGALGKQLPSGKVLKEFPAATILAYTGLTGAGGGEQDETTIAEQHARKEAPAAGGRPAAPPAGAGAPVDAAAFWARAAEIGYRLPDGAPDIERVRELLKARGYTTLAPSKVAEMLAFLQSEFDRTQAERAVSDRAPANVTTDPETVAQPDATADPAAPVKANGRARK